MMQSKSEFHRLTINKTDLFIDTCKYLMFLIALFSIAAVFYTAAWFPKETILCLYLLFIPSGFSFLLTRFPIKLLKMLSFQLVLILSPLVFLLFRPPVEAIIGILLMFIIITASLARRYSRHPRSSISFETLGLSVIVHTLLLIMCGTFQSGKMPYFLLAHSLISLCIFFAARQKYTFETAYGHVANSPTQPSGSVKRQNTLVIVFLCVFSMAVIPLVVFFPYSILYTYMAMAATYLIMGLAAIYNFLINLFMIPELADSDPIIEEAKKESSGGGIPEILQYILVIILLAVFCLFLFHVFKKIFIFIVGRYRKALPVKPTVKPGLIHDEIISLKKSHTRHFRKKDFGTGPEREVRKLYYRSVKKEIRSGAAITSSQTPGEIIEAVKKSSGNDFTKLTGRYEQVRYGIDAQMKHHDENN